MPEYDYTISTIDGQDYVFSSRDLRMLSIIPMTITFLCLDGAELEFNTDKIISLRRIARTKV